MATLCVLHFSSVYFSPCLQWFPRPKQEMMKCSHGCGWRELTLTGLRVWAMSGYCHKNVNFPCLSVLHCASWTSDHGRPWLCQWYFINFQLSRKPKCRTRRLQEDEVLQSCALWFLKRSCIMWHDVTNATQLGHGGQRDNARCHKASKPRTATSQTLQQWSQNMPKSHPVVRRS